MEKPEEDLTGMTPQQAKGYTLEIIKAMKAAERQYAEKVKLRDLWQKRLRMAEENQRLDLAQAARKQLGPIEAELLDLKEEQGALRGTVLRLKEKLRHLSGAPQLQADAAKLAAQMEELTGSTPEEGRLHQALQDTELDIQLEALKQEMEKERS